MRAERDRVDTHPPSLCSVLVLGIELREFTRLTRWKLAEHQEKEGRAHGLVLFP